jgi:hypothetical protein
MPGGTLDMADLLATTSQLVIDFDENRIWEVFKRQLDAHNRIYRALAASYCEVTTKSLFGSGGVSDMTFAKVNEYGAPKAQKVTAGQPMGLPLWLYNAGVQWTRMFFQKTTVAALAAQFEAILTADMRNLVYEIKSALMVPTNYSFTDESDPTQVVLPVKRLANADGFAIPTGPNGEVFDASTHTHYLGSATLTNAALKGLIATVREHGNTGGIVVEINQAQEDTVRGLTDFKPYVDARIAMNNASAYAMGNLSFDNIYNRAIGLFDGATVWVKPWVPPNYEIARATEGRRPLGLRVPDKGPQDLIIAAEDEAYPLRGRIWERQIGVGVINRVGAAVLYSANSTYAAPTLAA